MWELTLGHGIGRMSWKRKRNFLVGIVEFSKLKLVKCT
jgi:hypothetical protein